MNYRFSLGMAFCRSLAEQPSMSDTEEISTDANVLSAVGDETRIEIIMALIEHRRGHPRDPGLTFSELHDHVDVRDSGRFNYHLDKLRGRFVQQEDEIYTLTYAGRKLAVALLAGTYRRGVEKGPVEYGTCPRSTCTETLYATYSDGYVRLTCDADHLAFQTGFPPSAAVEHSMEDLVGIALRTTYNDAVLIRDGICSDCYGSVERQLITETEDETEMYVLEGICERCGRRNSAAAGFWILTHPATVSFLHDHGLDIIDVDPWNLQFVIDASQHMCVSTDPLRVRVEVALDDDELHVILDDHGTVVDTERPV